MPTPVLRAATNHLELEAQAGGYEAADEKASEIRPSLRGRRSDPRGAAQRRDRRQRYGRFHSGHVVFDFAPAT
jgi:hypothetical protein